MKVARKELLETLNAVKPGLASKEILEQSNSFLFVGGQVITFNDEVAVHAQVQEGLELEGAVPAKEMIAILSRFSGDEVTLTVEENELKLTCGRGRAGIRLEAEVILPLNDLIQLPTKWKSLPADFVQAIKTCLPSAAHDLTYPILSTVHITSEHAESTDNDRITRFTFKNPCKGLHKQTLLLPLNAAQVLARCKVAEFAVDSDWGHFKTDTGVIYSCRTVAGDYPDLSPFLTVNSIGELHFPDKIGEILDRAGVFLSGMVDLDNSVNLSINEKGLLTVKGEGDSGWYEESLRVPWTGGQFSFSIHPSHLQSVLGAANKAEIGEDRIMFVTESFTHVVALEAK